MRYKVGFKRRPKSKVWLGNIEVRASNNRHAVVLAEHKLYDKGIRKPWVVIYTKQLGGLE